MAFSWRRSPRWDSPPGSASLFINPELTSPVGTRETLGFGFPTALGVKAANPDKAVIAVAGDGGFMFGVQELATAVQHHIGVAIVLFNNNAFGNVRRDQEAKISWAPHWI